MDKRRIYHIVEWVVALAACAFLVWKIVTYEDYASLWASLLAMAWPQWMAIIVCIALMPVNMGLETWRWHSLMNEEISWREAQRQVYYSKLAGLITPWRLGEYPARGLLMEQSTIINHQSPITNRDLWSRVLSMGAVGSATMTTVIIIAGIAAMAMYDFKFMIANFGFVYLIGIAVVLLLLGVALYFAPRLLKRWATVSHRLVAISLGQSFIRLFCWCVQLYLVLFALGAITPSHPLSLVNSFIPSLFIYYLLVTITPNVPIAEVGVRGAWAIAVFGTMNAALAGVLLWGINTLLPCLIWPFIKKNNKNLHI